MKLLVLLVPIAIWLSTVNGGSVCPDDPKDGLKPPKKPPVYECDLCEEMFNEDSDFMIKCGSRLGKYLYIIRKKCETAKNDDHDFQAFIEDVREYCKTYCQDIFEFPMCGCNPCVKLQKLDGDFMTKCAPHIGKGFKYFVDLCYCYINSTEELWALWRKIEDVCLKTTKQHVKLPMCRCDVCWLLMEPDSDFMQKCGKNMDSKYRKEVADRCEKVKCDPQGLWYFNEWLNDRCVYYGWQKFEIELCECNECWMLFDEESVFSKTCAYGLTDEYRKKAIYECFAVQNDMDALWEFFDRLERRCYKVCEVFFPIPMCECEPCWLLKDPSTEFYQKCFYHLSEDQQNDMINYCLKTWRHPALYEKFLEYVKNKCYYCTYQYVEVPTCGVCSCVVVDLIFVVDTSGSIQGFEDEQKQFLTDVCNALTISSDCTKVGLIQFASSANIKLPLANGDDKTAITDAIDGLPAGAGSTDIGEALNDMVTEFKNAREGAVRVGVVLTDGRKNGPTDIPDLAVVDPGLTMIAVGVGDILLSELEFIASGDGDENVITVDDFEELLTVVPELLEEICNGE